LPVDAGRDLSSTVAAASRVVTHDTTGSGAKARVVIDYGQAVIEAHTAVGGTIIEMDLRMRAGRYRIDYLGLAVFAD